MIRRSLLPRWGLIGIVIACACAADAAGLPPLITETPAPGDFPLSVGGHAADVWVDPADFKVVQIAAEDFASDVFRVTGAKPRLPAAGEALSANAVIAGTVGKSPAIDALVRSGKLDAARGLAGKWESFVIAVVPDPMPGVTSALVVAGSDRRGTAFGIYELSEQIGVSPWYWWADVAPRRRDALVLRAGTCRQGPPSVKYRGIFINDEDWGMQPWAAKTFEPEVGDIGPRTYAKIFELLLRLKANTLWPAMHPCTRAFNLHPDDKRVADDYAIVMGSSHCEPLLRDNVTEWDEKARGPWSYVTNAANVDAYWEERLRENGRYENLYTVGMRGIHDGPMPGGANTAEKVRILQRVIDDQRAMLARRIDPDLTRVPQLFCPYKEVLALYQHGLRVPDDVTLCWADDNFGYIRQLSTPAEQRRAGGAGVYYHVSYWGAPHDYLWLCSTPPALIREEMTKAYDYGARTFWMLNVGDLKPAELDAEFFLRLAWDQERWGGADVRDFLLGWAARELGRENAEAIADVMGDYYQLNFARKPEHMGWNRENKPVADAGLSPTNYGDEVQRRLDRFDDLSRRVDAIEARIEPERKDAFYELVVYPVRGAALMNRKVLCAQKSRLYAARGRASADDYADRARRAYEQIRTETDHYNSLAGGKWRFMMSSSPHAQPVFGPPEVGRATPVEGSRLGIAAEGEPAEAPLPQDAPELPTFDATAAGEKRFIDLFNAGRTPFDWTASVSAPWIVLSEASGRIDEERRIWVSVDAAKAPPGETAEGTITVKAAGAERSVRVRLTRPTATLRPDEFAERDGVVSMLAEHFARATDRRGAGWRIIKGLGRTADSVAVYPTTTPSADVAAADFTTASPLMEYDFTVFHAHAAVASVEAVPTHRIHPGRGLRCAIAVDDDRPQVIDLDASERSNAWAANVLRAAAIGTTPLGNLAPGRHTLKVRMVDPGVVLDKIVLDLGGLRPSYLGPPETR